MQAAKPYALTIAGFDPSGGAGLVADVKTFEANGVYGLSACTSITIQNDIEFKKVNWLAVNEIIEQLEILVKRFEVRHFKIGLIKNVNDLPEIINWIRTNIENAFIVWDPILKASAGFDFHTQIDKSNLKNVLSKIDLITPNIPEIIALTGNENPVKAAEELSSFCSVYLKGGHAVGAIAEDILFTDGKTARYTYERISNGEKHGSGCVLSSAITASLAKGKSLTESCKFAKTYINKFLASNNTLLGFHQLEVLNE